MPNNNLNNLHNNRQPRLTASPPPLNCASRNTHDLNSSNATSGLMQPAPWRDFYNRQDMMIMNEIMRAANLFTSNNNDNNNGNSNQQLQQQHLHHHQQQLQQQNHHHQQQQQQQQHRQTHPSSSTSMNFHRESSSTVPPGFVPMMVRPQMFPAPSAMHAINYGGAGDTAPLFNSEPPPGSMLMQNMLLVPVGQTAPMLESDLRRAQQLYPAVNSGHEPSSQGHNAHETPPMNAWPHNRDPQPLEFFERSRDIIRNLQDSWSPVYGSYVSVPVNQVGTMMPTTNLLSTHGSLEPYLNEGLAVDDLTEQSLWNTRNGEFRNENDNVLGADNFDQQFKYKNGPKPVDPPAFEIKSVLTYSQVVRNLAISHPLSGTASPEEQDLAYKQSGIVPNQTDNKLDDSIEATTASNNKTDDLRRQDKMENIVKELNDVQSHVGTYQQSEIPKPDDRDQQQESKQHEESLAKKIEAKSVRPRVETEQQKKKRLLREQKQKEEEEEQRKLEEQAQRERVHIEMLQKKLLYNQKNQQKKEEQMLKEQMRIEKLQKKLAFKSQREKEILKKEEQQREQKLKEQQQRQEAKRGGQRKKEKQLKKAQIQAQKQQKLLQQQQQQQAGHLGKSKQCGAQQKTCPNSAASTVVSGKSTSKTATVIKTATVNVGDTSPTSSEVTHLTSEISESPAPASEVQGLNKDQTEAVLLTKSSTTSVAPSEPQNSGDHNNNGIGDLHHGDQQIQSSKQSTKQRSRSLPPANQSSNMQAKVKSSNTYVIGESSSTPSVSSNDTGNSDSADSAPSVKKCRRRRRRRQRKNNLAQHEQQPSKDDIFEHATFTDTLCTVFQISYQLVIALLMVFFHFIRSYFQSR